MTPQAFCPTCSNTVQIQFKSCSPVQKLFKILSKYCPDRGNRTRTGTTVFEQYLNRSLIYAANLFKYCSYTVHRIYCNQSRIRIVFGQVLDRSSCPNTVQILDRTVFVEYFINILLTVFNNFCFFVRIRGTSPG